MFSKFSPFFLLCYYNCETFTIKGDAINAIAIYFYRLLDVKQ